METRLESELGRSISTVGFFAALIIVGSCGGSPTRPDDVNGLPPPRPSPGPTTVVVTGYVSYLASGRGCAGCTVEVMDGPSAGTAFLTEANGRFSFSLSVTSGSSVTLRASQNGFEPATQTTRGGELVIFRLESSDPLNLTGTYGMTFEAGASCTELPESVRRREYAVTLAGQPEHPRSVFVTRPVDGSFDTFQMIWRVSDKEAAMLAARGDGGEIPDIVERLGSDEIVELGLFSGLVEITTTASIRIPAFGFVSYCKAGSGCTTCWSNGQPHLLTMTKR